jgi:hypothetical protein
MPRTHHAYNVDHLEQDDMYDSCRITIPLFNKVNRIEAEQKIENIFYDCLKNFDLDYRDLAAIKKDLEYLKQSGFLALFELLFCLKKAMEKVEINISIRGGINSSWVAFVIGLTRFNPIQFGLSPIYSIRHHSITKSTLAISCPKGKINKLIHFVNQYIGNDALSNHQKTSLYISETALVSKIASSFKSFDDFKNAELKLRSAKTLNINTLSLSEESNTIYLAYAKENNQIKNLHEIDKALEPSICLDNISKIRFHLIEQFIEFICFISSLTVAEAYSLRVQLAIQNPNRLAQAKVHLFDNLTFDFSVEEQEEIWNIIDTPSTALLAKKADSIALEVDKVLITPFGDN